MNYRYKQDCDELSRVGIENILLTRMVRKLWRVNKEQQQIISIILLANSWMGTGRNDYDGD